MRGEVPEGWRWGRVGGECDVLIGGTPARDEPTFWDVTKRGNNRWVSIADLQEKYISNTKEHISDLGVQKSNVKRISAGTVLMSFKLSIGRTSIAACDLYTNEAIAAFVPTKGAVERDFLYYALPLAAEDGDIDQAVKGKTLNKAKLIDLEILLPPLPEQKKIAAILSSVDEAIQTTQAVIDQARRVQNALLEDLMTRGIGHTRFKQTEIGEIPEGWDVRPLGDVTETLYVPCPLLPEVLYFPTIVRRRHRGVDFPESRLGSEILVKEQYRVVRGSVLLSKRQLVHGAAGFVASAAPETAIVSKEYLQLVGARGLSSEFLYCWARTAAFQNIVERSTYGVDREKFVVNERWFFSSKTPVPPAAEQAAIVAVLNQTDEVASANHARLIRLRAAKSGLLQDLLTGRVRVTP